jgi:hypothetical protein
MLILYDANTGEVWKSNQCLNMAHRRQKPQLQGYIDNIGGGAHAGANLVMDHSIMFH